MKAMIPTVKDKSRMAMAIWEGLAKEKRDEIVNAILDQEREKIMADIATNNDAIIMLTLVQNFGFDKVKCKELFDAVADKRLELCRLYEYTDEDDKNDCAEIVLKRYGIDVAFWREQKKNWKKENDKVWNWYEE